MYIYIGLIFFLIFGYMSITNLRLNNRKKMYCILSVIVLILICGLRDKTLGITDTQYVYIPAFERVKMMTYNNIISIYKKDVLFFIVTKVFTIFIRDAQTWIFVLSIPLISMVGYLIYKESKSPVLSFIMYIALNFYGLLSFTILRQGIALSFIILAYFQIKNKKLLKFIIFTLIASCFHQTALIFMIAYPLVNMKVGMKQFIFIIVGFLVSIIMKGKLIDFIFRFLTLERYQLYSDRNATLSLTAFFMNILILVVCFFFGKNKLKEKRDYAIQYNLLIIGTFFTAFANIIGEFYRLSMYFSIFSIVLLPNIIQGLKERTRKFIYYITVLMFIIYFFVFALNNAGIVPYKFFWER